MSVPVDRQQLRERQRPLKERYGADPDAAVLRLRAEGSLAETGVTCSVDTGLAIVDAGLHAAAGGDASSACSGDLLLQALVACAGVTLRAVAVGRGLQVSGTVHAEGELDLRGTLGVDRSVPVGFRTIVLHYDLRSEAPAEDLDALVATSEAYCVVLQTLTGDTRLRVTYDVS